MKLKYIPKYIKDVIDNAFCNLFFKDLNIMDSSSTIDYIKNNKASIARYGDGTACKQIADILEERL